MDYCLVTKSLRSVLLVGKRIQSKDFFIFVLCIALIAAAFPRADFGIDRFRSIFPSVNDFFVFCVTLFLKYPVKSTHFYFILWMDQTICCVSYRFLLKLR